MAIHASRTLGLLRSRRMTDVPPPPSDPIPPVADPAVSGDTTPPPAPAITPPGPGGYYVAPKGDVPADISGVYYNVGLTILLMIVTCGIWGFFWTYRTNEDLKKYNGDGIGGVLGVVIYFLLSIVLMFTIPNEVKNAYERDGQQSPVSAIWGLWFLLPIIGHIIWYVKVQHALNEFWSAKGSAGAAIAA